MIYSLLDILTALLTLHLKIFDNLLDILYISFYLRQYRVYLRQYRAGGIGYFNPPPLELFLNALILIFFVPSVNFGDLEVTDG